MYKAFYYEGFQFFKKFDLSKTNFYNGKKSQYVIATNKREKERNDKTLNNNNNEIITIWNTTKVMKY